MNAVSFQNQIKENKVFHVLDRILLFVSPLVFVLGLYFLDHYIVTLIFTNETIVSFALVLMLALIVLQARALGRDNKTIELLIIKEMSSLLLEEKRSFAPFNQFRRRYRYITDIPTVLLLLVFIATIFHLGGVSPMVYNGMFAFLLISYVLIDGLVRISSFISYENATVDLYKSIVQSKTHDICVTELIKYDLRKNAITISLLCVVFLLIGHYIVFIHTNLLYLFMLTLSFWVLLLLGKGLYDASEGFKRFLTQIDILREKLGLLNGNAGGHGEE